MRLFKFAIKIIIGVALVEYIINHLGIVGALLVIGAAYYWMKYKFA